MSTAKNVLGTPLKTCCESPRTGFYRNGRCDTGAEDLGMHIVCCKMTTEFLAYSREAGNDLSTPVPEWGFPGLKPGDCWCVCVARWKEAYDAGAACPVNLEATHISALEFASLEELRAATIEK